MNEVIVDEEHREAAGEVKRLLAVYRQSEDLINIGAYARGSERRRGPGHRDDAGDKGAFAAGDVGEVDLHAGQERSGGTGRQGAQARRADGEGMKRFSFPLEKVLAYRRQLEAEKKRTLGLALSVLRRRERDLEDLHGRMTSYRTRLAEIGTGRVSARELALYRSYVGFLEAQVDKAAGWVRDAMVAVEEKRADLAAAGRDTKVMETVEDHARSAWEYEAGRQETHELDEVGSTRFVAGLAAKAAGGEA